MHYNRSYVPIAEMSKESNIVYDTCMQFYKIMLFYYN